MTEQAGEFVDLLNFENTYEILNQEPFTIRKKSTHYVIKEYIGHGYVRVNLNGGHYQKHRLIGLQFLHNDDPVNKTDIDHINHQRDDNRLINLRWVSRSTNLVAAFRFGCSSFTGSLISSFLVSFLSPKSIIISFSLVTSEALASISVIYETKKI